MPSSRPHRMILLFFQSFPPVVGLFFFCTFLASVFRQFSHHSRGLPRFPQSPCFFSNHLSFLLTMCPAHFHRLSTICHLCHPQFQLPLLGHSFSSSPLSLHRLFNCSRILVVCVVAVLVLSDDTFHDVVVCVGF